MSPDRVENAILAALVTPAGMRELHIRVQGCSARVRPHELRTALRRLRARGWVQRFVVLGPPRRVTRSYELSWRGVLEAMARTPAAKGRALPAPSLAERRRMADRIRRCSEMSQALARLRAAARAAAIR